jgi:HEAT repeat protein
MAVALALLATWLGGAFAWPGTPDERAQALATGEVSARTAAALEIAREEPARATTLLLPALEDRDSGVRLLAARLLLRRGSREALATVTSWLTAAGQRDRALGLVALRDAHELPPEARHAAERALVDGDVPVRNLALDLLAGHSGPLGPLLRALDDDDRGVRLRAVRNLAAAGDARAGLALLARFADGDRQVRAEAVAAVAAVGDLRAVPALLRLVGETTSELRGEAAVALGHLRAEAAVPLLARLATRWPRDDLARRALAALGEIGTTAALETLVAAGREPTGGADVRLAFALAGARALPALVRELAAGPATGAAVAATALGELGEAAAGKPLVAALARRDAAAGAAVAALARLRSPEALAALVAAAIDASTPELRAPALDALAAFGDDRASAAIADGLGADDARIRVSACRLAATFDAGDLAPALARRLDDGDGDVRRGAALGLARVSHPSGDTVAAIANALARGGADDLDALGTALEHADEAVRGAAAPALRRAYLASAAAEARAAVARGLGALAAGDAALVDQLVRDLRVEGRLGAAAARALAPVTLTRSQEPAVLVAFAAGEPAMRAALVPALARFPAGIEALAATVAERGEAPSLRAAAAWGLATAAGRHARESLATAAEDPQLAVAANARAALGVGQSGRAPAPPRWVDARLVAPDGAALPGRWAQVATGKLAVWSLSDLDGRVHVAGLPAGDVRVTAPSE